MPGDARLITSPGRGAESPRCRSSRVTRPREDGCLFLILVSWVMARLTIVMDRTTIPASEGEFSVEVSDARDRADNSTCGTLQRLQWRLLLSRRGW